MTDSHDPLPPDPLDDLASAHLDGQATAPEAARIAADAALTARVADMAAVRAAIRSDVPPMDEDRREASITAALAAFDEGSAEDAVAHTDGGTLTPITAAASRRVVSVRTLRLVAAVAVAVVLALAVPLLGRLDPDSSEDDLATSALEESADDASQRDTSGGAAATGSADPQAPTAEAFALPDDSPVALGAFGDLESLADAVRPLVPSSRTAVAADPTTTAGATTDAAGTCGEPPGAASPDAGPPVLTGTATVDERPVLVFVYERPTGERTMVVVGADDCAVISTSAL